MNTIYAIEEWKGLVAPPGSSEKPDIATLTSLESLFSNAVQAVVALVGVALLVMFFVAGFSFIFSGGDPKKLEQAKGTLTNAIIGLVIIVAAYIILNFVKVFTGVDVTIFKMISF
jgi:hypothetical protein